MESRIPGKSDHASEFSTDEPIDTVLDEVEQDSSTASKWLVVATRYQNRRYIRFYNWKATIPTIYEKYTNLDQKRVSFYEDMLQRYQKNHEFFNNILERDESLKRTGIFNMHRNHSWSVENSHIVRFSNF